MAFDQASMVAWLQDTDSDKEIWEHCVSYSTSAVCILSMVSAYVSLRGYTVSASLFQDFGRIYHGFKMLYRE